jgi:hypothetical protein
MAPRSKPALAPPLADGLSALRSARRATEGELKHILAGMAAIPAEFVVRADREIAFSAGLGWWHLPPARIVPEKQLPLRRLLNLFSSHQPPPSKPASERELLQENPDYAWIFLSHPDGRLREAALRAIKILPPAPFFLTAVAWRLNDWVWEVRQAAEQCLQRVSSQITSSVAADAAPYLLARRFVWRRWSNETRVLDLIIARDDVLAVLASHFETQRTGALGVLLRQALRFPKFDRYLPRLAAHAAQPSVRAVAYQSLISGKVSWPVGFDRVWIDKVFNKHRRVPRLERRDVQREQPVADCVAAGIHDRSAFVRKIAADAMIAVRSEIPDEAPLVAALAKDRNSAVRSRADFMLRHPVTSADSGLSPSDQPQHQIPDHAGRKSEA